MHSEGRPARGGHRPITPAANTPACVSSHSLGWGDKRDGRQPGPAQPGSGCSAQSLHGPGAGGSGPGRAKGWGCAAVCSPGLQPTSRRGREPHPSMTNAAGSEVVGPQARPRRPGPQSPPGQPEERRGPDPAPHCSPDAVLGPAHVILLSLPQGPRPCPPGPLLRLLGRSSQRKGPLTARPLCPRTTAGRAGERRGQLGLDWDWRPGPGRCREPGGCRASGPGRGRPASRTLQVCAAGGRACAGQRAASITAAAGVRAQRGAEPGIHPASTRGSARDPWAEGAGDPARRGRPGGGAAAGGARAAPRQGGREPGRRV